MSDEKRTLSMRDGSEKIYGVSMGCLVDESSCIICGGTVSECEHTRPPTAEETRKMRRMFLEPEVTISWVGPSKCEACKTPMEPSGSIHWACVNEDCDQKGIPIHTGVYPVLIIKDA